MLWRSSLRYQRQHPWLLLLSILGVALGVAVVIGIDLANHSARRAFMLSAEGVAGKATHQVVGRDAGLPDSVYVNLRVGSGMRDIAPVVEGYATAPGAADRTFSILGIDPLAEPPFRSYVGGNGGIPLAVFMARPGAALIASATAEELGLVPGDSLALTIQGQPNLVQLAGFLEADDERSADAIANLLVVDIATAQRLLDVPGQISRIDVILPDGPAEEAARAALLERLPPEAQLKRSSSRTETLVQMTRAFELNLTALSLLALVVGMFLIYNTMTFSVVQRRNLIGRMRALGITRQEIFRLVLGEALVIGLIGTVLGLLIGIVLGAGLVRLVTQTINDLYFALSVRALDVSALSLAKGLLLGMGATVFSTLRPAFEATSASPSTTLQRSQEETQTRRLVPVLAAGGGVLAAGGLALLYFSGQSIALSHTALLLLLLAFACCTPIVIVGFVRLLRPLMGRMFGLLGRMAASGIGASLSRTAVAIAALMVAISATVGVGVMVDSFRQTVVVWLENSLQADVYIQPPQFVFRSGDATIRPDVAEIIEATEGVGPLYTVRRQLVESSLGPINLTAIETIAQTAQTFQLKSGDASVWDDFAAPGVAFVSEPFSYRYNVGVGDTLTLRAPQGDLTLTVGAIFYDYATDQGVVLIHRDTYNAYYDDDGYSGIALYASSGVAVDELLERLRERTDGEQELIIRSNRDLRAYSLDVFDRTFTITAVLQLLSIVVAFIGVLSALLALQLERGREFAVMRANGLTPRQLWQYISMQTGLMGLLAGLLAIPLGLVLAYVLIFFINKRSFGWTLQVVIDPGLLVQAAFLGVIAALLAGLYPAWKISRANPAHALREE